MASLLFLTVATHCFYPESENSVRPPLKRLNRVDKSTESLAFALIVSPLTFYRIQIAKNMFNNTVKSLAIVKKIVKASEYFVLIPRYEGIR